MTDSDPLTRVREAADRRARAATAFEEAIIAASAEGVSYRDISNEAGISHQRVAQIIAEANVEEPISILTGQGAIDLMPADFLELQRRLDAEGLSLVSRQLRNMRRFKPDQKAAALHMVIENWLEEVGHPPLSKGVMALRNALHDDIAAASGNV